MPRSRAAAGHAASVHLHENQDQIFLLLARQAELWFGGERHELGQNGASSCPAKFRTLTESCPPAPRCW